LYTCKPLKSPPGLIKIAADAEPHSGFDMIPGIGFLAFTPGDFTTFQLGLRYQSRNGINVNRKILNGSTCNRMWFHQSFTFFCKFLHISGNQNIIKNNIESFLSVDFSVLIV
jgi:hypothetical protein